MATGSIASNINEKEMKTDKNNKKCNDFCTIGEDVNVKNVLLFARVTSHDVYLEVINPCIKCGHQIVSDLDDFPDEMQKILLNNPANFRILFDKCRQYYTIYDVTISNHRKSCCYRVKYYRKWEVSCNEYDYYHTINEKLIAKFPLEFKHCISLQDNIKKLATPTNLQ
jgi:hypothetical protein